MLKHLSPVKFKIATCLVAIAATIVLWTSVVPAAQPTAARENAQGAAAAPDAGARLISSRDSLIARTRDLERTRAFIKEAMYKDLQTPIGKVAWKDIADGEWITYSAAVNKAAASVAVLRTVEGAEAETWTATLEQAVTEAQSSQLKVQRMALKAVYKVDDEKTLALFDSN